MIKSGEVVGYENKGNFRDVVLENVLKMFSEKAMIEIVKLSSGKKRNKKAITSSIDTESDSIVHILIQGDSNDLKNTSPVEGKIIKPLYLFSDKEILLYAKLKKLKFRKKNSRKDKISSFVEEMEKKHPEIKRAIVNSYLELYRQLH